jgi:hypothetical protein
MTESTADYSSLGNQLLLLGLAVVVFALWGLAKVLPVLSGLFRQRGYNKISVAHAVAPVAPKQATQHYDVEYPTTHHIDMAWWDTITDCSDEVGKHVLIAAPTGGGKTTALRAILKERLARHPDATFIVIDPQCKRDDWGNITPIGARENWGEIEQMLQYLLAEKTRRNQVRYDHVHLPPIIIIMDEVNDIRLSGACPSFDIAFEKLSVSGRKTNMTLIIAGQVDTVEALGLKGKGEFRNNFIRMWLAGKAVKELGQAAFKSHKYACAIELDGVKKAVDSSFFPQYTNLEIPSGNLHKLPKAQPAKPLAFQINSVPRSHATVQYPHFEPVAVQERGGRDMGTGHGNALGTGEGTDIETKKLLIKLAIYGKISQRKGLDLIKGNRDENAALWREMLKEIQEG